MNWRRAALASVFVVPVMLLFRAGMRSNPRDIVSPLPGNAAPPFALAVFAPGQPPLERAVGDTVRLADMRGRVIVVNFWASWCLACRDEHAGLSEVALQYADKPVSFVGTLYQDRTDAGSAWIREMGGQTYPSVDDPRARTAIDYGLYGVPETFFIAPDGRIARKIIGPATPSMLRQVIDSLLGGTSP